MDALGPTTLADMDRIERHCLQSLPEAIKAAEQHAKAQAIGQNDLFGLINEEPDG